jgi:hypothetical protein
VWGCGHCGQGGMRRAARDARWMVLFLWIFFGGSTEEGRTPARFVHSSIVIHQNGPLVAL